METMRFKVRLPDGKTKSVEVKRDEPIKALKPFEEYSGKDLLVLGMPYGGPIMGRDLDGEAFYKDTDPMLNIGDVRPVTYYHGYGPDDPYDWQDPPVVIGAAKFIYKDKRGFWFHVKLDADEPLAKRVEDNVEKSKASSGAIGHLVRVERSGLINVWPVGELALFDTNDWRLPANDFAVVQEKKSEEPQAEAKADEAKADAAQTEIENIKANKGKSTMPKNNEELEEELEEKQPVKAEAPVIDYAKMAEALVPSIKSIVNEELKALADEEPTIKGAPAIKKVTERGFSKDNEHAAFMYYMRTGRKSSMLRPATDTRIDDYNLPAEVKAALQEGDDTEGGYLVPDDFVPKIHDKANERAVAVRAGATVITTSLSVVPIPIEGTQANWSLTTEESTYGDYEGEFDEVSAQVYKSTVMPIASQELLADNKTNLESWLFGNLGARFAVHENSYTIAGTGTSQPQGILVGGTAGLTFDDTNSIAVGEIPELMGKLKEAYQFTAAFTMQRATYYYLIGLTGNQFQLWQPNMGVPLDANGRAADGVLMNKPVYFSDSMGAYSTTAKKSIAYGDWSRYALVRRSDISVLRNPYLYAHKGQVAFHFFARWGGVVPQAEAFQYGTQA